MTSDSTLIKHTAYDGTSKLDFGSTSTTKSKGSLIPQIRKQCIDLLGQYSGIGLDNFYRLSKQLDFLFEDDEWDDEQALPEIESFKTLLKFMSAIEADIRSPYLTTTQKGNFVATWQPDRMHRISIEFFKDNRTKYSFLNLQNNENAGSEAGNWSYSILAKKLVNNEVVDWMG